MGPSRIFAVAVVGLAPSLVRAQPARGEFDLAGGGFADKFFGVGFELEDGSTTGGRVHDGGVAARREVEASAWSAGVAAVQRAGLTTWDRATLLQRVWGGDALKCTGCGGRMKLIAVIKDRAVIERILKHIGEESEEPLVREGEGPLRRVGMRVG
ncbi:MAG: hypothetical protein R3A48_24570 [Polyangiales bacterium]